MKVELRRSTASNPSATEDAEGDALGPAGRASRLVLGGYFLFVAIPFYLSIDRTLDILGSEYSSDYVSIFLALVATVSFLLFYLLFHTVSRKYLKDLNPWVGAVIANVPPFSIFIVSAILTIGSAQIAVFTYVGSAMFLAGLRKDPGCEVMSPANALLGSTTHFACIIFSPIDWAERKLGNSFRVTSQKRARVQDLVIRI